MDNPNYVTPEEASNKMCPAITDENEFMFCKNINVHGLAVGNETKYVN